MINISSLYGTLGGIVASQVGSHLSTLPGTANIPSVVRARFHKPMPDYPYVTLDITQATDYGEREFDQSINTDNNIVYDITKKIMVSFTVYGGYAGSANGDLAIYIANQIHACFKFDSVRGKLKRDAGVGITYPGIVRNEPIFLSDRHIESSNFFMLINLVDTQIDLNSGIIESIEATGNLNGHPDDSDP